MNQKIAYIIRSFFEVVRKRNRPNSVSSPSQQQAASQDSYDYLFSELNSENPNMRTLTPLQYWNQEIELYKSLPRPGSKSCPLSWWKLNANQLPHLSVLAKRYLGIPASQASCERIFSISKNDITETRTSMLPDLAESLLFLRKTRDIISMIQEDEDLIVIS